MPFPLGWLTEKAFPKAFPCRSDPRATPLWLKSVTIPATRECIACHCPELADQLRKLADRHTRAVRWHRSREPLPISLR